MGATRRTWSSSLWTRGTGGISFLIPWIIRRFIFSYADIVSGEGGGVSRVRAPLREAFSRGEFILIFNLGFVSFIVYLGLLVQCHRIVAYAKIVFV